MDQNVILVETVPLEFDLESLGCRLRIRPGQTKFMDRLSRLAEEAARVARPKAVARLCGLTILDEEKVQVGEVTFSSPLLQRCIEVQSHPYKLITYCFYIFIVVQRRPEETQLTACILLFCRYIRGYPFMECPHTARNQPCEMTGIIQ